MKIFLKSFFLLLPLIAALCVMNSCHKELFNTKSAVSFSTDTLTFDTVFTTLGSVTQSFTVRNTQNKSINISDIKLMQLAGTQFRINVNGLPAYKAGLEYKNVDIPAHDSIYIFVEVTINPNAANNPFVVLDQIQFQTNGITQNVVLEAMGQNAHYWFSYQVHGTDPPFYFKNDRPNIIINKNGGLPIFAVDSNAKCYIQAGAQIYMAPGAVLTVDGLLANDPLTASTITWSDSIKFQYIRTDYAGLPGEWLGITYSRIATINLSHVIIDQSTFGLSDEYVLDLIAQSQITTSNLNTYNSSPIPNVTLNNVIIRNTTSTALTAIRTNLVSNNCLFHSSQSSIGSMVLLGVGGTYNLNNCTLANSYNQYTSSQNPLLTIFDKTYYLNSSSAPVGPFATTVNVNNTIVAGNTSNTYNELSFGLAQPSSDQITFNNCFLTENRDSLAAYQITNINCIDTAIDPQSQLNPALFTMPSNDNYMPDSVSIVLGKANSSQLSKDLFDQSRPIPGAIGAIEYHH